MKKTMAVVGVVALAAVLCLVLAGCAAVPNGKYVNGLLTYEFSGNKVTLKVGGSTVNVTFNGTYTVSKEGEEEKITFTFGEDDASKYNGTFSFSQDKSAGTVTIGGVTYTKQK